jgi:hypothetical protein
MSRQSEFLCKKVSFFGKKALAKRHGVVTTSLSGDAVFNSSLGLLSLTSLAPITGVLRTNPARQGFTASGFLQ